MKILERTMWCLGLASIAVYLLLRVDGEAQRLAGLTQFEAQQQIEARSMELPRDPSSSLVHTSVAVPASVAATSVGLAGLTETSILGVLRLERIRLEVPVKYGTGEDVLSGAAGLIEGTAWPGTAGNIAIAAHRDTFFRGLEQVVLGDRIQVETSAGTRSYRVTELSIVDPTDIQVLEDTGEDQLTLVTCYPFHYFGSAPKRYIVRAIEESFRAGPLINEEA
jgi:sortase A